MATGSKSLITILRIPGTSVQYCRDRSPDAANASNMVNPSSSSSSSSSFVVVVVFGLCKVDIISMFDIASVTRDVNSNSNLAICIFRLSFVDAVVVVVVVVDFSCFSCSCNCCDRNDIMICLRISLRLPPVNNRNLRRSAYIPSINTDKSRFCTCTGL